MFLPIFLSQLAIYVCVLAAPTGSDNQGLLIKTTSGTVQGIVNATTPNVRQFLGIPYAEPPIGALRFAAPQAKSASTAIINATKLPASCMQQFSNSSTIYTAVVSQFLIHGGQSEDCLYVSYSFIFLVEASPVEDKIPLYKIPDKWVEQTQAHIVVVMNYRLNVFGFHNAKGFDSSNSGLLDQGLAVEWAQANVPAFGGDPLRIIPWGQSAGGTSVSIYPYGYPDDPIVAGLIANSGSTTTLRKTDTSQTELTTLANLVGWANLNDIEEVACMRQVPAVDLENALSYYTINRTQPAISFIPVADNITQFTNVTDRAERGMGGCVVGYFGSHW